MPAVVRDVMSTRVHTVGPADPIGRIVEIQRREHVRHVPVVDGGQLLGVVTARDLSSRALGPISWLGSDEVERQLEELRAGEVMTSEDLVTTTPDAPLREAANAMLERQVGCLPVLENGRLIGIVTASDFVRLHAG